MTCGLPAEDCALTHWCPVLGAHREAGQWRADCPACHSERAIEFDVPARAVRWRHFCLCDRGAVRQVLAGLLPGCLPRHAPAAIDRHAIEALALDRSLPPMTLRLRLLMLTGVSTPEALDKLGVRRDSRNRSRVIHGASKRTQNRRSREPPERVNSDEAPGGIRASKRTQNRR